MNMKLGVREIEVKVGDGLYPKLLAEVVDHPKKLFLMGTEENINLYRELLGGHVVAMVGTRKVSDYGRRITVELAAGLAVRQIVVVSGMMYGVDEIAHRAVVDNGGFTVGVWAGGIDTLFGTGREGVARKILERGVILSEYARGVQPQTWTFPERNRIVAGMSEATIVTEAAMDSGSLITAGDAANYGREVLAVPGPVTSPVSGGVNYLIKNGAKVVTEVEDILAVLGIETVTRPKKIISEEQIAGLGTSELEKKILVMLYRGGQGIDTLVEEIGENVASVSAVVMTLELRGVVRIENGKYVLAN